jgi:hypothetical protein
MSSPSTKGGPITTLPSEILEMILVKAPAQTLLPAMRVSTIWCDSIKRSTEIQENLILKPMKPTGEQRHKDLSLTISEPWVDVSSLTADELDFFVARHRVLYAVQRYVRDPPDYDRDCIKVPILPNPWLLTEPASVFLYGYQWN